MGTTKGEVDFAIRRALNILDQWNNVSGVVTPFTSHYYELQGVIEDAVHCGIQVALGIHARLETEKE